MSASNSNPHQFIVPSQNNQLVAPAYFQNLYLPQNLLHCPPPSITSFHGPIPPQVPQTAASHVPITQNSFPPNSLPMQNSNTMFGPPPPPVLRLPNQNTDTQLSNSLNNVLPPLQQNSSFPIAVTQNFTSSFALPGISNFPPPSISRYQTSAPAINQNVSNNRQTLPVPPTLPYSLQSAPIAVQSFSNTEVPNVTISNDEMLNVLLEKFSKQRINKPSQKFSNITVAEYTSLVKKCYKYLAELSRLKEELRNAVHDEDKQWNQKIKNVIKLQDIICEIIAKISDMKQIGIILPKLMKIKKKRSRQKQKRLQRQSAKEMKLQERCKLHATIDHWHEALREKAIQQKRDAEMKKDANYILAEVRKKIDEAKHTLEKFKVLEKLRHIRKENSAKKGLLILPKYDRDFVSKVSRMREVMTKQLLDYEAEERAMKVMLEVEQEGQREEEIKWRVEKLKKSLEVKHGSIKAALFGEVSSEPHGERFLFHQFYDAGNASLQNLIQIRNEWDSYLVPLDDDAGSKIPQEWVVPVHPSSEVWNTALQ